MGNTWNVVDGEGDQGLLIHVYGVLLRGETLGVNSQAAAWRVVHFFGPHKPWSRKARCLEYFDFLDQPDFAASAPAVLRRSTAARRCLERFEQKRACLVPRTWQTCIECNSRRDKSTCAPNATARCPASIRWWVL